MIGLLGFADVTAPADSTEAKPSLVVVSSGLGLFVGFELVRLVVVPSGVASLDLVGSSGTVSGVDVEVLGSDRISFSSPK